MNRPLAARHFPQRAEEMMTYISFRPVCVTDLVLVILLGRLSQQVGRPLVPHAHRAVELELEEGDGLEGQQQVQFLHLRVTGKLVT